MQFLFEEEGGTLVSEMIHILSSMDSQSNIPLNTLLVISETIFPASHLIGAKTQTSQPIHLADYSKQNQTTTKI